MLIWLDFSARVEIVTKRPPILFPMLGSKCLGFDERAGVRLPAGSEKIGSLRSRL